MECVRSNTIKLVITCTDVNTGASANDVLEGTTGPCGPRTAWPSLDQRYETTVLAIWEFDDLCFTREARGRSFELKIKVEGLNSRVSPGIQDELEAVVRIEVADAPGNDELPMVNGINGHHSYDSE